MESEEINQKQLIIDSLLVGGFSGGIAVFYRWILQLITPWTQAFYAIDQLLDLVFILFILVILALIVDKLLKWTPYSGGSGIPQIHAELKEEISVAEIPTIVSKLFGGAINNFVGLSLGREGPSIQLGGTIAKWLARRLKRSQQETQYLIAAGASAGLSAAFNAPIAGTLFAVEEMYHSFDRFVLIPALIASLVANIISHAFMGVTPAFSFYVQSAIPLHQYYWIILIGIVGGGIGILFNLILDYNQRAFARVNHRVYLLIAVFLLSALLSQFVPELLGGGHHLIEEMVLVPKSIFPILFLLVGNLLFTCLSFSTGAQGGIFLPVLVLGAATGALVHHIALLFLIPDLHLVNFLILGMVAVLTAVVRAPFMSILLISEMTSNPDSLMPLAIASLTALIVSNATRIKPVYTMLYEKLLARVTV